MAKKTAGMTDAQKGKKWTELAEKRFNRALSAIRGLTKLANTKRYAWTPNQIKTMKDAFEARLDGMFKAYAGEEQVRDDKISL